MIYEIFGWGVGWIGGCGYRIFRPLFEVAPLWAIRAFHRAADCVDCQEKRSQRLVDWTKDTIAKKDSIIVLQFGGEFMGRSVPLIRAIRI